MSDELEETIENIQAELDCYVGSQETIPENAGMDITVSTTESEKQVEFILPEVTTTVEVPATKVIKTEQVDSLLSPSKDVKRVEVVPEKTYIEIKKEPETVYLVPATSVMNISTGTITPTTPLKATPSNVVLKLNTNTVSVMASRNDMKTIQAIVKAPGMNQAGQMITKVIFANNPLPGQRSQPICLTPIQAVSAASSGNTSTTSAGQQVKIVTTAPQTILSPAKTINLNQATLLASPNKMIIVPGTPPKPGVVKLAISPNSKTPTKIMIPVSIAKSPQRIAPAPTSSAQAAVSFVTNTTSTTNGNKLAVAVTSPQKVILRQTNPVSTLLKPGTTLIGQPPVTAVAVSTTNTMTTATTMKPLVVPISNPANLHSIQVPGSKFQYLRLVTSSVGNTSGTKTATVVPVTAGKPIIPGSLTTTLQTQSSQKPSQVKIAVPIAPVGQQTVVTKQAVSQQRILIPASNVTNVAQLRAGGNITVPSNLASLPPGTALISASGNLPGLVMVPAQYVTQFQQQFTPSATGVQVNTSTSGATSTPQPILPAQSLAQGNFVPIAAAGAAAAATPSAAASLDISHASPISRHQLNGRSPVESNGLRQRKPCNCTKSQCLKLYCDCFATGEFCNNCNCNNCYNNLEHEEERQKAIKACLDRNPQAFHPKIGKAKDGDHERRHNKGCNCKRSGCLKNYCECYEAKIMCSNMCKCVGCKNFEESAERKTLMHLADAAEVRVQQQTAAKNKFSSQVQDVPSKASMGSASGERLPFTFITPEVVQATCQCLLAQAEEGEKSGYDDEALEKLVLEEFGRCLLHIIKYANRTKTKNSGVDGSLTFRSRTGSNS